MGPKNLRFVGEACLIPCHGCQKGEKRFKSFPSMPKGEFVGKIDESCMSCVVNYVKLLNLQRQRNKEKHSYFTETKKQGEAELQVCNGLFIVSSVLAKVLVKLAEITVGGDPKGSLNVKV